MIPVLFSGLLVVAAASDRPSSRAPAYGRVPDVVRSVPDPLTDVGVQIDPATFARVLGSRDGGEPVEIYYAPNVDAAGYALVGLFPGTWRFQAELLHGQRLTSSPQQLYPGDRVRLEPAMGALLTRRV